MILVYQDGLDRRASREQRKGILTAPSNLHPATLDYGVERRRISTLHCGLSTVEMQGMMLDSRNFRHRDAVEPRPCASRVKKHCIKLSRVPQRWMVPQKGLEKSLFRK